MLVATWNVNSIRAREDRVRAWVEARKPDVLCFQELKVEERQKPLQWLADEGFHVALFCQKTYNGVAIASRTPLADVRIGLCDGEAEEPARLVGATVSGVRVLSAYFPNGQALGTEKYEYKLRWMQRLRAYLDRHHTPAEPLLLCGDFNVAPEPRDVHDPARWETSVLYSPAVREALEGIRAFGFTDVFRQFHEEPAFSWWDYRLLAFPRNHGLRIDHVFATKPMADRAQGAEIDREERKGKGASDHAPVVATFRDSAV